MSRGTPLRNIRIDDATWQAAKVKAEAKGTDVSTVIRDLLARWIKR